MSDHRDKDVELARLASAVLDGTPVDWDSAKKRLAGLESKLDGLRLIESIAATQRNIRSPGRSWGALQLLDWLGGGVSSDVYRAHDPVLQREVALKLWDPALNANDPEGERILQEARRLASVRHPNIVAVHGVDRHAGRVGMWTDLLSGRTLEQRVKEGGHCSAREAALVGIDLCRALSAVHAAGLVHGDVKSANIMRERDGRVVLMDFGSAVMRRATGATVTTGEPLTSTGERVSGTPLFMAPERLLGDQRASPSSDIYALGVVLYRLVSGRFPVEAENWSELLEKHRRAVRIPLPNVRPGLKSSFVQVIERVLDPDPIRRYGSAGELERALAATIDRGDAPAGRETAVTGRVKRPLRWFALSAALVLAAVTAFIVLAQFTHEALSVEAAFYKLGQGSEERLMPGASIAPGDRLFLELMGRDEIHVYVLNEDQLGNAYVLFPTGIGLQNPLVPDTLHRLPGRHEGAQAAWKVTNAGGRETFLVIAARRPFDELDRRIGAIPRSDVGREVVYGPVAAGSPRGSRGVGGVELTTAPADGSRPSLLAEIARDISSGAGRAEDVWVWQIELTSR